MAEIFGKVTGVCGGRGGSMHLADASVGNFGGNVVMGSMMATCLGPALAWKMRGEDRLSAVIVGDGAVGRGEFGESLNLASTWKLPVLYCCINNQYAISTHVAESHPTAHLSEMAAGFKVAVAEVDGNDIVAATQAARQATDYIRSGQGPYFLEFHTWRWQGIFSGEMRDPGQVKLWKEERDPIRRARAHILEKGAADSEKLDAIQAKVETLVSGWVQFARESPMPDASTALEYVYAETFGERVNP
jgi:pyruvate dehydrogenase E1 component alpha subunit